MYRAMQYKYRVFEPVCECLVQNKTIKKIEATMTRWRTQQTKKNCKSPSIFSIQTKFKSKITQKKLFFCLIFIAFCYFRRQNRDHLRRKQTTFWFLNQIFCRQIYVLRFKYENAIRLFGKDLWNLLYSWSMWLFHLMYIVYSSNKKKHEKCEQNVKIA